MSPRILVVDDNLELLSLLQQLFEGAGYEVVAASKGKQAIELAHETRPKVAVLDVLLPDMMGFHLADALRAELPELGLVFVTGVFKGGRHAVEAGQKYGPVAYFEKPFEASKLIEAVKSLAPVTARPFAAAAAEEAFDVELDVDVTEDAPVEAMELTGRIKVTGGDNIRADLRGAPLTTGAVAHQPSPGEARQPAPGMPALAGPTRAQDPSSRRGELKDNLPSLLTAFYQSKETGELGIQRGKVKKVIYFERGQPVFALSNLLTDRFGQFLVRVGKVQQDQLKDAASVAHASGRRTGDVLVERGLLKDTERLYYVGQQVKSIIYSLFGWEDGAYLMTFKDKANSESIKLDIHPANLIVRGVKKLYKPERLERLLDPSDRLLPSLQPAYALNEIDLERWEAELLPKVDGTRSAADLVQLTGRPEHVVMGFLCAMLALSVVEKRQG